MIDEELTLLKITRPGTVSKRKYNYSRDQANPLCGVFFLELELVLRDYNSLQYTTCSLSKVYPAFL
jgi:hypothetical protein